MPERHVQTCALCEAMCGLIIETEGDRVTSIRGDEDDRFSRGHICPKAVALQDIHEDKDRLRRPVKRDGDRWVEIGWDEAYDLVASRLREVQTRHGDDAVAVYLGNPTVHSAGASLFAPDFIRSLHTRNRYSATSVDQLPHHVAAMTMFGHALLIPIPDIDRTDHLLILGANPAVSNGSLMTAPDVTKRLKAIRARGGKIVLVDPRKSETAALADEHHFITPGGDAYLLLGMLQVVFAETLTTLGALERFTDGVEAVRDLVAAWTPERVAPACGIAAEEIRRMAREFATAKTAVCYGRVGVSMQEYGALACWLITVLNAVTGRIDAIGGAMFTNPAVDPLGPGDYFSAKRMGRWKSRVRGLPEFAGELPVSALAEEMDTEGKGQVRALVTHAGNPVLSTPNGRRLERALSKLDFVACIDFYVNETTRHAHVILPPTFQLERDHYDVVFHLLAIRNTAKFSPAMFTAPPGTRHDWQILHALTTRMRRHGGLRAKFMDAARGLLGPRGMLDIALRSGPHGSKWNILGGGLTLAKLKRQPHGVDLGALTPMLPARLKTKGKRVQLAPDMLLADIARLERALEATSAERNGALALISRRELRSNNSWMHNSERLVRGKRMCTLLMNPDDATHRGLADGERVTVTSRVGAVEVELETTATMMAGVVSLPHGWGHDRDGVQLGVARAHGGASVNDLTDDARVDELCGNAGFSGVGVHVEKTA